MDKSHLTAITRKAPSAPIRWLNSHNLLVGKLLDFGCGKGTDAEFFEMDCYDPHYFPERPTGKYDTITCTYVLNVVHKTIGDEIVKQVLVLLSEGGVAYFTVRRDIKKEGLTSRGTFQRNVEREMQVITENRGFCIYKTQRIIHVS